MSLPPGPWAPSHLQSLRFLVDEPGLLDRCVRRYGDVFTIKVRPIGDLVLISRPEHVKQVFTGDSAVLHAGDGNAVLEPIVGQNSVLLLDRKPHLRQRKLLLPPFHGDRMKVYGELIEDIARAEMERWPTGTPYSLHDPMQRVTLRVIVRAVFGIQDADRLVHVEALLREMLDVGVTITLIPRLQRDFGPGSPGRRFFAARDKLDAALYEEIAERRRASDLDERTDVLSLLLGARDEDGKAMSDQELRDELMTLLVAGHETTATALAWTFERLARHPRALAQAREDEGYLDAVIKETLRVRPVLNFAMRRVKAPYRLDRFELPAGSQIGVSLYLAGLRPEPFPEPRAFRPDRWLAADRPSDTYTWIPFGGGVRRCLGAAFALFEMRAVLRTVLPAFEVAPGCAGDEPRRRRAITFVPRHGARVVLTPRRITAPPAPVQLAA